MQGALRSVQGDSGAHLGEVSHELGMTDNSSVSDSACLGCRMQDAMPSCHKQIRGGAGGVRGDSSPA
eukprot:3322744-Alexandrium_andersonii.AAC.1